MSLITPFVLIDILYCLQPPGIHSALDDVKPEQQLSSPSAIQSATLITFVTLSLASFVAYYKTRTNFTGREETKEALKDRRIDGVAIQEALIKAVCVGLPIFASLQLGGSYVAILLLVVSAAGLMPLDSNKHNADRLAGWKRVFYSKIFTTTAIVLSVVISGSMIQSFGPASLAGSVAIFLSLLLLSPPFRRPLVSLGSVVNPTPSAKSTSAVSSSPLDSSNPLAMPSTVSPLMVSTKADSTLLAAVAMGVMTLIVSLSHDQMFPSVEFLIKAAVMAIVFCLVFLNCTPHRLRSFQKTGLLAGSATATLSTLVTGQPQIQTVFLAAVAAASYLCLQVDDKRATSTPLSHSHSHMASHTHTTDEAQSRITLFLLHISEDYPSLHTMLADKNSRGIFFFMLLNFTFMIVQATYALLTDSLGLMSDSIHMFFDCLALAFGLFAAVLSKRPPSPKYPYGFGKMDSLAGFGNGIFLLQVYFYLLNLQD